MEISNNKKPNKYAALATYLVAVICLILGMFLPLFNGKDILALQLPGALNALAGNEVISTGKPFTLAGVTVLSFGADFTLDFMALTALLFAAVTVLSLLALIPIGISVKKGSSVACIFEYIIEAAAVIVLSLYVMSALTLYPYLEISYNMVIALAGPVLMLIVLSCMNKKATGVAKTVLFLLSSVAVLTLFALAVIIPAIGTFAADLKLSSGFIGDDASANYVLALFNGELKEYLQLISEAKGKALIVLMAIIGLVVIINFFIDTVALTSNAKRTGLIFNMARYALVLAVLVCILITAATLKAAIGLLVIVLALVTAIQILISVLRYIIYLKKVKRTAEEAYEEEQTLRFEKPRHRKQAPVTDATASANADPLSAYRPVQENTQLEIVNGLPEPVEVQPELPEVPAEPADNGSVQIHIADVPAQPVTEVTPEPVLMETNDALAAVEEIQPAQPAEEAQVIEEVIAEPVQPVETVEPVQPVVEIEQPVEPIQPVQPVQTVEPAQPVEPVQPVQPVQPVEPVKPVQPAQPVEPVKPVQPAQPVEPVKPVQPAQPVVEVYTVNKIYGGPVDDFIRKLTNDEQIEFAMTFIEKSRGDLSNLPEYVVGGDNKRFFNSVFIYLGRLRGMISDGLLNKMFKELNMM